MADNATFKIASDRNLNDVALELTLKYYEKNMPTSIEEMQVTYSKFYAAAHNAKFNIKNNTQDYIPDEIKKK